MRGKTSRLPEIACVFDEAGNMIETHDHDGDVKEP